MGLLGADWQRVPGFAAPVVVSLANRARGDSNALAVYAASGVPATADVDAGFIFRRQTNLGEVGLGARVDPVTGNGYYARYLAASNAWQAVRVVNGTTTVLDTLAQATANGADYTGRLKVRGTDPVRLTLVVNGTTRPTVQDADAARITAPGVLGLRLHAGTTTLFETRGWHCARAWLAVLPVPPSPVAAQRARGALSLAIDALPTSGARRQRRALEALSAWTRSSIQRSVGGTLYTLTKVGPARLVEPHQELLEVRLTCTPPPPGWDNGVYRIACPVQRWDGTVYEAQDAAGDPDWAPNLEDAPAAATEDLLADWILSRPATGA